MDKIFARSSRLPLRAALAVTFAAAALGIGAAPTRAQVSPADIAAPIIVKVLNSGSSKSAPKGNWLKAEVIHIDSNSIIVREQTNEMMIHTFTYSDALRTAMQKFQDSGGYQYGDKVKI